MTIRRPHDLKPIKDPCRRCGVRWIQCWIGPYAGLCRGCARETGWATTTKEIEAERVRAHDQAIASQRIADSGPRPTQEKVIQGEVFEVVWDGS